MRFRKGQRVQILGQQRRRPAIWDRFRGWLGTIIDGRLENHIYHEHYYVRLDEGHVLLCPPYRLQESL